MKEYLKIKCVSLAAEARLIRREEQIANAKKRDYASVQKSGAANHFAAVEIGLKDHRRIDVRREARVANIAYGFAKGKEYSEIEKFSWSQPNWDRVKTLALRYGRKPKEDYEAWEGRALRGAKAFRAERDFRHPGSQRGLPSKWTEVQKGTKPE